MSELVIKHFSCTSDFERVNDFLSRTYGCDGINNWDNARWTFNRYCVHNEEELRNNRTWEQSVQIWEDTKGSIVAAAHIEEPGDYFFQVHPDYKYLEEEMVEWAIDNCRKYYPGLNKIVVSSGRSDCKRKALYNKYQAVIHEFTDADRILELKEKYSTPKPPGGYEIINLNSDSLDACYKISNLYTYIWPESRYMPNGETVASMTRSISYKKDLSFIIVNDKERYAAFTFAWVDSINKMAHFYPVAVDPDYLNTNLLEVMLKNALNTLIDLGYEKATIGGWYREEENQVFKKLGFVNTDYEESYDIRF